MTITVRRGRSDQAECRRSARAGSNGNVQIDRVVWDSGFHLPPRRLRFHEFDHSQLFKDRQVGRNVFHVPHDNLRQRVDRVRVIRPDRTQQGKSLICQRPTERTQVGEVQPLLRSHMLSPFNRLGGFYEISHDFVYAEYRPPIPPVVRGWTESGLPLVPSVWSTVCSPRGIGFHPEERMYRAAWAGNTNAPGRGRSCITSAGGPGRVYFTRTPECDLK